jgi:hypothetical protein
MVFAKADMVADVDLPICPACRIGRLHVVERMLGGLKNFFRVDSS